MLEHTTYPEPIHGQLVFALCGGLPGGCATPDLLEEHRVGLPFGQRRLPTRRLKPGVIRHDTGGAFELIVPADTFEENRLNRELLFGLCLEGNGLLGAAQLEAARGRILQELQNRHLSGQTTTLRTQNPALLEPDLGRGATTPVEDRQQPTDLGISQIVQQIG